MTFPASIRRAFFSFTIELAPKAKGHLQQWKYLLQIFDLCNASMKDFRLNKNSVFHCMGFLNLLLLEMINYRNFSLLISRFFEAQGSHQVVKLLVLPLFQNTFLMHSLGSILAWHPWSKGHNVRYLINYHDQENYYCNIYRIKT